VAHSPAGHSGSRGTLTYNQGSCESLQSSVHPEPDSSPAPQHAGGGDSVARGPSGGRDASPGLQRSGGFGNASGRLAVPLDAKEQQHRWMREQAAARSQSGEMAETSRRGRRRSVEARSRIDRLSDTAHGSWLLLRPSQLAHSADLKNPEVGFYHPSSGGGISPASPAASKLSFVPVRTQPPRRLPIRA
jgi:hypothetical protein